MTTTRIIRREVSDTSDPDVGFTSFSTSGGGTAFGGGVGTGASATRTIGLSNSNHNSQGFKVHWEVDLKTTDDLYNIPPERCIVNFLCRPNITVSSTGGGLGVIFDIDYTGGDAFGISIIDWPFLSRPSIGLTTLTQTGSAVTTVTANQDDIVADECNLSIQINTSNNNSNGLHSISLQLSNMVLEANTGPAGSLNRKWEADNHVIDGLNGDSIDPINVAATMSATALVTKFGESSPSSSFGIVEDSVNLKLATATPSTVSTLAVTPKYISDVTKSLSVVSDIISSTNNLVLLPVESYSTSTSITIIPRLQIDIQGESSLSNTTSSSPQGNAIYDIGGDYTWDTVNAIALANDNTWEDFDQVAWESWPDNTWGSVLESWDEWDLNVWARSYNLVNTATIDLTDVQFKPSGASDLSSAFSLVDNSAFEQRGEADLTVTVTGDLQAAGVLQGFCNISSAFSPTLSDTIIFDQPSAVTITGAFTPVLTANATFSGETALSSAFGFAITPTHRRGPYQLTFTSAFTQPDTIPSRRLGPYQLVLPALASKLVTGKLYYQADPHNIAKVLKETRIVTIGADTRITAIDQENRVNKVVAETRTHMVSQETRRHKLRIPPIKDRFVTPKIRAEV